MSSSPVAESRDDGDSLVRELLIDVPSEVLHSVNGSGGAEGVVGIDIGGTLTKVVRILRSRQASTQAGGRCRLACQIWRTRSIEPCLEQIQKDLRASECRPQVSATGGGALKYQIQLETLATRLAESTSYDKQATFESQDEMICLAAGLQFLQQSVSGELFSFDSSNMYPMINTMDLPTLAACQPVSLDKERPVLLANVGTGTSFVLCPPNQPKSAADAEPARRVGGTPLSGSTLLGVLKLLTGKQSYTEILELACQGDSRKVDLTVGDVYGSDYTGVGLSGHRAAGFLARVATGDAPTGSYTQADLARSLVFAIAYNIGQQAVLQARVHHAARQVCFTGSFGSGHPLVMGGIDYAVRMNGENKFTATFLKHESFLGAIGAWALGATS